MQKQANWRYSKFHARISLSILSENIIWLFSPHRKKNVPTNPKHAFINENFLVYIHSYIGNKLFHMSNRAICKKHKQFVAKKNWGGRDLHGHQIVMTVSLLSCFYKLLCGRSRESSTTKKYWYRKINYIHWKNSGN